MSSSPQREQAPIAPNATGLDRIDKNSDAALTQWAMRLDVTSDQLKEAITKVGDKAADVELYLKGSRSSSNDDMVERKLASDERPRDLEQAGEEKREDERPLKNA